MVRYLANPVLKGNAAIVLAGGVTADISNEFAATAEIMQYGIRVEAQIDYTQSANSTLKLQHGILLADGTTTSWADVGSHASLTMSSTANQQWVLTLHPAVSADAAVMPLRGRLKVVLVTGASSAATVNGVTAFVPEMAKVAATNVRSS